MAALEEVIHPEDLAPEPGKTLRDDELVDAFHLGEPPRTGRMEGHLFLLATEPSQLQSLDRLLPVTLEPNPGETAFVLVRDPAKDRWRYEGIADWFEDTRRFVMRSG